MVINKVSGYGKGKGSNNIKINFDLITLDIFCKYLLQNNSYVKMEHLVNLRKLMSIIDYSLYENDPDKMKRINFIIKALEARLDNNISDRDIIFTFVNGGLTFKIDFIDYDNLNMSKDEIFFIHNLVRESLEYKFIYQKVDQFQDICTRFKTSDYSTRGNIVNEFEKLIDETKNEFRHSKVVDNSLDMTFSLRDGQFENAVTDTWNLVTSPSRRLLTGMQGFNEMTGGGVESGRVYMLLGTSGIGKSLTLLNLMHQIKRFNKFYKTKDPTRTPCVCLLTMENTVVETITRLFDLVIEGSQGMANYSCEQVIDMLRNQGELVLNDSTPIDIVIKYKPNKSVDTSYLYTLYDDLYDDGYEMICLIQDHVKRIRSIYYNTDLRLELGDVVNELKVFAADKDIPIITNSHLNRDAAKILEDAMRKGNQDTGKLLGKSNIGESMLMIDNLDCAMIITLDYDKEANKYMTFNLIKMRDKTNRTYIAQPFVPGSGIRLVEDVGGIPQFKESIHTAPDIKHNSIIKLSGSSSMMNNIDNVIDINEEDFKDNAFNKNFNIEPEQQFKTTIIKPIEFMSNVGMQFKDSLNNFSIQSETENKREIICPISFKKVG